MNWTLRKPSYAYSLADNEENIVLERISFDKVDRYSYLDQLTTMNFNKDTEIKGRLSLE